MPEEIPASNLRVEYCNMKMEATDSFNTLVPSSRLHDITSQKTVIEVPPREDEFPKVIKIVQEVWASNLAPEYRLS